MPHSGEANVRERTQGTIPGVELRGAQDWAATGSGGKGLASRKTQTKPEGKIIEQVDSTVMASKLYVFLREDEKLQVSALLG